MNKNVLWALSLVVAIVACTKEEDSNSGVQLEIPYVTSPVSGSSLMSQGVRPLATSGISITSSTCSGCGTSGLAQTHNLASLFVMQGKMADANSCMIKAVSAAGVVPGLTSGEYRYLDMGEIQSRIKVTLSGSVVASFSMATGENGSRVQVISGTNDGTNGTFKMRSTSGSGQFFTMDATGVVSGESWGSKTLTVGHVSGAGQYFQVVMSQGADYMDFNAVLDAGTLGTLDTSDMRWMARAQLIGNSPKNYALGDGSYRLAIGSNSAVNSNWNGDTKAEGSGPTTYDSYVASATLPAIPTTRVSAFTAEETWDCAMSSPVKLMEVAQGNSALMEAANACQEGFE